MSRYFHVYFSPRQLFFHDARGWRHSPGATAQLGHVSMKMVAQHTIPTMLIRWALFISRDGFVKRIRNMLLLYNCMFPTNKNNWYFKHAATCHTVRAQLLSWELSWAEAPWRCVKKKNTLGVECFGLSTRKLNHGHCQRLAARLNSLHMCMYVCVFVSVHKSD